VEAVERGLPIVAINVCRLRHNGASSREARRAGETSSSRIPERASSWLVLRISAIATADHVEPTFYLASLPEGSVKCSLIILRVLIDDVEGKLLHDSCSSWRERT